MHKQYVLVLGPHQIDVSYDGLPIPGSPLAVEVVPGNDPSRVKAYGPGLDKALTNVPQQFTIETRGAGQGSLALAVEGEWIRLQVLACVYSSVHCVCELDSYVLPILLVLVLFYSFTYKLWQSFYCLHKLLQKIL